MKLFYMKQMEMIIPINIFLTLLVNSACKSEKNVSRWGKFGQRKEDRSIKFKFDTETHMQIVCCIEQYMAKRFVIHMWNPRICVKNERTSALLIYCKVKWDSWL